MRLRRDDVDSVANGSYSCSHGAGGVLQEKGLAFEQRLLIHPDNICAQRYAAGRRRSSGIDEHFATAEVDFVFERHRDALRRVSELSDRHRR